MRVFVAVVLIMLLIPVVAQAEQIIVWDGELYSQGSLNDGRGADNLWDYTYHIQDWLPGNRVWALVCPVNPGQLDASTWSGGGWSGQWYDSIPSVTTSYGNINDSEVVGRAGIVWTLTGNAFIGNADYFHFETTEQFYPVISSYDGDGWTGLTTYSANPEPASLLLMTLVMAGGSFWRKRRNRK